MPAAEQTRRPRLAIFAHAACTATSRHRRVPPRRDGWWREATPTGSSPADGRPPSTPFLAVVHQRATAATRDAGCSFRATRWCRCSGRPTARPGGVQLDRRARWSSCARGTRRGRPRPSSRPIPDCCSRRTARRAVVVPPYTLIVPASGSARATSGATLAVGAHDRARAARTMRVVRHPHRVARHRRGAAPPAPGRTARPGRPARSRRRRPAGVVVNNGRLGRCSGIGRRSRPSAPSATARST